MRSWRRIAALAGLGMLGIPAFGAEPARPGTVNYVEGAAYLNGSELNDRAIGNAALDAGDELTTGNGRAEVLLTPGIFLRLGTNSAVKMIAPDLALTQVELEHGRAAVEVDQLFKQNNVQIMDAGVTTQLVETGYYEFDASHPQALVFKGQAEVQTGNNHWQKIKNHHEVALVADARLKSRDFNASGAADPLYNWSQLRSQYLAEANNQIAGEYAYAPGFNPGWFWDPYALDYTFIGMDPFASPFGWGFYPWGGYGGWGGYGFYGRGIYGHGVYGHGIHGHGIYGHGVGSHASSGYAGRPSYGHAMPGAGFHGGGGFQGGGGFHGGGGGGRR